MTTILAILLSALAAGQPLTEDERRVMEAELRMLRSSVETQARKIKDLEAEVERLRRAQTSSGEPGADQQGQTPAAARPTPPPPAPPKPPKPTVDAAAIIGRAASTYQEALRKITESRETDVVARPKRDAALEQLIKEVSPAIGQAITAVASVYDVRAGNAAGTFLVSLTSVTIKPSDPNADVVQSRYSYATLSFTVSGTQAEIATIRKGNAAHIKGTALLGLDGLSLAERNTNPRPYYGQSEMYAHYPLMSLGSSSSTSSGPWIYLRNDCELEIDGRKMTLIPRNRSRY